VQPTQPSPLGTDSLSALCVTAPVSDGATDAELLTAMPAQSSRFSGLGFYVAHTPLSVKSQEQEVKIGCCGHK